MVGGCDVIFVQVTQERRQKGSMDACPAHSRMPDDDDYIRKTFFKALLIRI